MDDTSVTADPSRSDGRPRVPVTVLICTRNRPAPLQRCLTAILNGSATPAAVLVVDQSDGDRTRRIVASAAEEAPSTVVERIPSPPIGMAAGQNLGFRHVATPVVAVTDDDCVPARTWVETAWQTFASDPDLGLLTGRVLPAPPTGASRHPVSTRTNPEPAVLDDHSMPWDAGSGNNFALAVNAITRIGGNDERLGPGAPLRGGADMDLFRRALRAGVHGRYEPELVVAHERVTMQERLDRRVPYGYGVGVACMLWSRQHDGRAPMILARWFVMRGRRLAGALVHGRRLLAWEEVLVLLGTLRGLARGLVLRPAAPVQQTGRR